MRKTDERPNTTASHETLSRMWGRASHSAIKHRSPGRQTEDSSGLFQQPAKNIVSVCSHLHDMRIHGPLCRTAKQPDLKKHLFSISGVADQRSRYPGNEKHGVILTLFALWNIVLALHPGGEMGYAGDHKGPPRAAPPPSPLRIIRLPAVLPGFG